VTTLEYAVISTDHPQLVTMTPNDMRAAYLNATLPLFDEVVTISSVEHSGLGRYGDGLNPWGDVQAIARAWCVAKPNAGRRPFATVSVILCQCKCLLSNGSISFLAAFECHFDRL
jgi:hypothetical protein